MKTNQLIIQLLLFLSISFILFSCNKENDGPAPGTSSTLIAVAGDDRIVPINQTVTLVGPNSSSINNKGFTYQ